MSRALGERLVDLPLCRFIDGSTGAMLQDSGSMAKNGPIEPMHPPVLASDV
jgi:hypothetical protein